MLPKATDNPRATGRRREEEGVFSRRLPRRRSRGNEDSRASHPCQKQKKKLACMAEMKREYTYVDGRDSKAPRGDNWHEQSNKKEAASFSGQDA